MKRILAVLLAVFMTATAQAQTVEDDLVGLGMSAELADYISGILPAGAVLDNNTYFKARNAGNSADVNLVKLNASDDTVINSSASDDLILQLEDDASRQILFDAASDAAIAMKFGDAGTTATQILTISASTSDADDDSSIQLAGGGAFGTDGTRGATIVIPGEEVAGGSDITYNAGASDTHIFKTANTETMNISAAGVVTAAAGFTATTGDIIATAGDISIVATGKTIEFESGTAASACIGNSTFNGTTAVTISTTCATTGSRIFLSMTGDGSGAAANDQVGCWATNIVNATSFDADCSDANNNATFNWIIFHEAP